MTLGRHRIIPGNYLTALVLVWTAACSPRPPMRRMVWWALLAMTGCQGEVCEDVPSLAGVTVSVDLAGAPAYLEPGATLAAIDAALEGFGAARGPAPADVTIVWALPANPGWLAVTLDQRAIVLNPTWAWSLDGCKDRVGYDVTTILEHELGHVAGLQHTATGLMKPWIATCEVIAVCEETDANDRRQDVESAAAGGGRPTTGADPPSAPPAHLQLPR